MNKIPCPHCGKETISAMQRIKAAHWFDVICAECGRRSAMQPILMALLFFVHIWNIFFFGFMAIYDDSTFYFSAMVIGWLLIEFFAFYIPLVRLKSKSAPVSK